MQANNEGEISVTELNKAPVIKEPNLKNKGKWHKIKKTLKKMFKNGGRKTKNPRRKTRKAKKNKNLAHASQAKSVTVTRLSWIQALAAPSCFSRCCNAHIWAY